MSIPANSSFPSLPALRSLAPTWELSVEGGQRQAGLVGDLLERGNEHQNSPLHGPLLRLAGSLSSWGWSQHPLEHDLLAASKSIATPLGMLTDAEAAMARMLNRLLILPESMQDPHVAEWEEIFEAADPDALLNFIKNLGCDAPDRLFWCGQCFDQSMDLAHFEHTTELLDIFDPGQTLPPGILQRFTAELYFHSRYEAPEATTQQLDILDTIAPGLFEYWKSHTRAELALRSGDLHTASSLCSQLHQSIPWHTNLLLKTHYLQNLPPLQSSPLGPQQVAVLAYSWNKATPMAAMLDSLYQSDLGTARIFVLDNGSTDGTGEMLKQYQQQFGADRFHIESLDVNIGAPAARNWLLSLAQVQQCEYVAYLDDDIILPRNWLRELLTVMDMYPQAATAGCRVTDHTPPHAVQAADFHPLSPQMKGGYFQDMDERITIFNNCQAMRDTGQFTYMRPCLSVTGACHMLRMGHIREVGPFDVRFSPSQFDDLEHDIRSFLAGHPAIYHGGLQIPHMQHSSLRQASSPQKTAHIHGNKLKMEYKYTDREMQSMYEHCQNMVWNDLTTKAKELKQE